MGTRPRTHVAQSLRGSCRACGLIEPRTEAIGQLQRVVAVVGTREPRAKQGPRLLRICLPHCHPTGTGGAQEGSRCCWCYTLMPSVLLECGESMPPGHGVTRSSHHGWL